MDVMNAFGRFVIVSAVALTGLQRLGWAQTADPGATFAPRSAQPDRLNGLSPNRTGSVAGSALHPNAAILAGTVPGDSPELSVSAASARALTPTSAGWVDLRILDRETAARFVALDHCRIDAARRRRVSPGRIAADPLTLRWTIVGKGLVTHMEVIGSRPVDADVLDCIKRDARSWRFTAPVGGDVRLQRAFAFRPLSPEPPAR